MRTFDIADIRSHPELKAQAAAWFHSKWEVPEEEYLASMDECISGGANVPQWYVALEDGVITGGVGVIENDFHVRRDLSPNVCALYVEPRRRGLGLAGALLGRPPILIRDEPTNGLDPVGIHEIRTLIRSLPERYDCTVLVSSHLLGEVQLMADDVGILNHGRLLYEGTPDDLRLAAKAAGLPSDDLEETFLSIISEDDRRMRSGEYGIPPLATGGEVL